MVPTTRSADASTIVTPMRSPRCPAEKSAGRSTPSAAYSSMISWGNVGAVCSPMGSGSDRVRSSVAVCTVLIRRLSVRLVICGSRRLEPDDDRFAGRGVAGVRGGVQGDEHVGLRVVGVGAAACGGVVDDAEAGGAAFDAVLPLAHEVGVGAVGESEVLGVLGVDHDDAAAALDAAVAVVEAVDRGVVLVVGAQGLEQEPALGEFGVLDRCGGEVRLAGGGGEAAFVAGRVGEGESAGPGDAGDAVADRAVVLLEVLPRGGGGGAEDGAGEAGDDRGFGEQVGTRGGEVAA